MIHVLSEEVLRAAFWRFGNGTLFRLGATVYRKASCCSATYLDKLHGEVIRYFNPFRRFSYVAPRKTAFTGTVVDDDAMAVILTDDPGEYRFRACEYLDKLREQVEAEELFLRDLPNFSAPPERLKTFRVSRFALVLDAALLPLQAALRAYRHGVPAAQSFLRVYPRWLKDAWKIARWDFWNGVTPKPFYPPVSNTITHYAHYRWNSTTGRYEEFK